MSRQAKSWLQKYVKKATYHLLIFFMFFTLIHNSSAVLSQAGYESWGEKPQVARSIVLSR